MTARWKPVSKTGRYEWHDHRMHYMGTGRPAKIKDPSVRQKVFDRKVPMSVDGKPARSTGGCCDNPMVNARALATTDLVRAAPRRRVEHPLGAHEVRSRTVAIGVAHRRARASARTRPRPTERHVHVRDVGRRGAVGLRRRRAGPLFILYSSGSTAKPKGIVHTTGGYLTGVDLDLDLDLERLARGGDRRPPELMQHHPCLRSMPFAETGPVKLYYESRGRGPAVLQGSSRP